MLTKSLFRLLSKTAQISKICYNKFNMYRLSIIISEIYNKYLPLAEKNGIRLNLDFADTTQEISDPEEIAKELDEHLSSALKRTDRGEIKISVDRQKITITDTGTTLSKPICSLLSKGLVTVKSRVGFGTSVILDLSKIKSKPEKAIDKPTAKQ